MLHSSKEGLTEHVLWDPWLCGGVILEDPPTLEIVGDYVLKWECENFEV